MINYKEWSRLFCLCIIFMLMVTSAFAQQQAVTGTVTDPAGETIIGASIQEKGTSNGTITDIDGGFNLTVQPGAVLEISFIGYKTKELKALFGRNMAVVLEEATEILDEVVVVGYGVQKKATLSGSVTSVKGNEIVKAPVMNVSNSLAGRMPGVVAISGSSEPGYDDATIRVRGVNTFGKAQPLVVVDGVPGRSLERVDPSSIETISVMKDASAAIYGAQAANGVILITTKRGQKGKPTVKFSINHGYSRPTKVPEMANSAEYGTLLNEIDKYAGQTERYTPDEIQKFRDGSDPWSYPNTDWFAETLRSWSPQTSANATIEGGSDNMNYFVSVSAKTQDGIYKKGSTSYNQYDLRVNLDWKINKHVDVYMNVSGRMEDRNYPMRSAENIFRMLMRSKPNMPAYWPNGMPGPDIEFGDNPVVIVTDATGYDKDKRYVVNGDFGINVKVPYVDGLTLKATASLDKTFRFRKRWETPWYLYSWDGVSRDTNGEPILVEGKKGFSDPRLTENMEDNHNILLSGLLNYNKTITADHVINVMAGVERITGGGDDFEAFRRYYLSTAIDQLFAGGQGEMSNTGKAYKEARLNYFGRVNYSYQSKYLAEFVWRYQGSYIFDDGNKFGFFPGVSLGYVMSEEKYWERLKPIVNFAKIRASWGQTGNDLIDPYQYLAAYDFNDLMYMTNGGGTNNQALKEGVAPNANVTWEKATQKNIGIDLQFLDGDLAFTFDYFNNERSDILWKRNASVPGTSGLTLPDENLGKVRNQGVDFSLDYRKRFNDFTLGVGINGVYAKNKILFWDEASGVPEYQQSTGSPIDAQLYYKAIGIFRDWDHVNSMPHWAGARPGDIIFEDYNDDDIIDGNDRVRMDKSKNPTFTGGLNIDMAYKGFDLSILFQGAAGGVFYQDTESGDFGNFLKSFYDKRWTEDNPTASYPRTYNRSNEYWVNQKNTFWVRKSDYIRLKNIELGYTLPQTLTKRVNIEHVRFYVSAYNLLTYSPDMKDYDPENTSERGYNHPLNKIVNLGLSVTF
ncbi:TonB-dependent receptor [Bacteroides sp. 51]|uniref:SusC/RagA family TonB-linked outer membrane protein n=1 Tax=Bacteroides sp. 51 TaxID=2302938 RepID=UPI0013D51283|nr:TonB-dependent receptor [Bacteroides sp. 51]NDV82518.1 TonB-dependent receptor [Bacteroides sp. 51]